MKSPSPPSAARSTKPLPKLAIMQKTNRGTNPTASEKTSTELDLSRISKNQKRLESQPTSQQALVASENTHCKKTDKWQWEPNKPANQRRNPNVKHQCCDLARVPPDHLVPIVPKNMPAHAIFQPTAASVKRVTRVSPPFPEEQRRRGRDSQKRAVNSVWID